MDIINNNAAIGIYTLFKHQAVAEEIGREIEEKGIPYRIVMEEVEECILKKTIEHSAENPVKVAVAIGEKRIWLYTGKIKAQIPAISYKLSGIFCEEPVKREACFRSIGGNAANIVLKKGITQTGYEI